MLKKTITYENPFTDEKVVGEFYFHISKADMVRMEMEEHKEEFKAKDGKTYTGYEAKLHRIVEAQSGKEMMPLFEDIIRRSYGIKEGDRFIKSEAVWADFKGTGAFDELLFELCTKAEKSAEFVNGIFPGSLEELVAQIAAENAEKPAAKTKPKAKAGAKKAAQQAELEAEGGGTKHTRETEIANATTEKPVILTSEEMVDMEPEDLQTGLASGKFKLS